MCLIAFAIDASARWPLVVASNRDEFHDRPTQPLARWQTASGQEIISGRDARAGGTWLGATPEGRVAFLTNVREPGHAPGLSSRGELVTRWLEGRGPAEEFAPRLLKSAAGYSGFNLVLGDLRDSAWTWLTNRSTASASGWQVQLLPAGVYGLSNASLDTPWPKTLELKRVLCAALSQAKTNDDLQNFLWPALARGVPRPPAGFLQKDAFQATEDAMATAFVDFPGHAYGTRSSTLLLVSRPPPSPSLAGHCLEIHE